VAKNKKPRRGVLDRIKAARDQTEFSMREEGYDPTNAAHVAAVRDSAVKTLNTYNKFLSQQELAEIGSATKGMGNVNIDVVGKRIIAAGGTREDVNAVANSITLLRGTYALSAPEVKKEIASEAATAAAERPAPDVSAEDAGTTGSQLGNSTGAVTDNIAGVPLTAIMSQNLNKDQLRALKSDKTGQGKQAYEYYMQVQNPKDEAEFYSNVKALNPAQVRGLEGQIDTTYTIISPAGFPYQNNTKGMEQAKKDLATMYEGPGKLPAGATKDWTFDPTTGQVTRLGKLEDDVMFKRTTGGRGSSEMVNKGSELDRIGVGKESAMANLQVLLINAKLGNVAKSLGAPTVPTGMRTTPEEPTRPATYSPMLDQIANPPKPYEQREDVAAMAATMMQPEITAPQNAPLVTPNSYQASEADLIAQEYGRELGQRKSRLYRGF
jgi:hypothetical protein